MRRRSLLKLGAFSVGLSALAGAGIGLLRPGLIDGRLSEQGRTLMRAESAAVIDGVLPKDPTAREREVLACLKRIEVTSADLPPSLRVELGQLLAVLIAPGGRQLLTGLRSDWPQATVVAVQASLQGMRTSSLAVRPRAYHALRELSCGAYYAAPTGAWPLLGYDDQPEV